MREGEREGGREGGRERERDDTTHQYINLSITKSILIQYLNNNNNNNKYDILVTLCSLVFGNVSLVMCFMKLLGSALQ